GFWVLRVRLAGDEVENPDFPSRRCPLASPRTPEASSRSPWRSVRFPHLAPSRRRSERWGALGTFLKPGRELVDRVKGRRPLSRCYAKRVAIAGAARASRRNPVGASVRWGGGLANSVPAHTVGGRGSACGRISGRPISLKKTALFG